MLGESATPVARRLDDALDDPAPWVRVAAADALARLGTVRRAVPVLDRRLDDENEWTRLQAINVLDRLDLDATAAEPAIRSALEDENQYIVRVAEHAMEVLEGDD